MKKAFALLAATSLFASVLTAHAESKRSFGWFDAIVKTGKTTITNPGNFRNIPIRPPCFPTTCETQGKNCGSIPDGCGGTLECGGCSGVDTCGGGGLANICGQVCYEYAYTLSHHSGVEGVLENNNCTDTPITMTRTMPFGSHYSRLSVSPNFGDLSFTVFNTGTDGRYQEFRAMMDRSGGWYPLHTGHPAVFMALKTALSTYRSLAIVSMETDGRFTLRLNENASGYSSTESRIVLDSRSIIPFEVSWIPREDWISSRRLIIATAGELGREPSRLYIVQLSDDGRSSRAVPVEDGVTAGAMAGYNPAPSRRGSRLLFVQENAGHHRIMDCTFDLSELDASPESGRAYCRSPQELPSLRGSENDYASPCWSYDNRWIFYAAKAPDTTWDIYRDLYGATVQREGLVITQDADEREVTCGPLILEAAPQQPLSVMPYSEPVKAYREPQTYELPQPCLTNTQCTNGRICREGYCRAP